MTRTGRAYAPLIDQHAYNEQKKLIQCVVDSPTTKGGIFELYSVTDWYQSGRRRLQNSFKRKDWEIAVFSFMKEEIEYIQKRTDDLVV